MGSFPLIGICALVVGGFMALEFLQLYLASRQLNQAIVDYRAAGLPWTKEDLPKRATRDQETEAAIQRLLDLDREKFVSQARKAMDSGDLVGAKHCLTSFEALIPVLTPYLEPDASFELGPDELVTNQTKNLAWMKVLATGLCCQAVLHAKCGDAKSASTSLEVVSKAALKSSKLGQMIGVALGVNISVLEGLGRRQGLAILHANQEDLALLAKESAPLDINLRECIPGEAYYGITILRSLDSKQVWNVFHGLPPKHPSVTSDDLSVNGKPKSLVARGILCKLLRSWTTAYQPMPDSNTDKQLEAIFTAFSVPGYSASGRLLRSVGVFTEYPEMLKNESAARVVTRAYGQILHFGLRSGSFPNRLDQVGEFIDPWSGLPLEYRKITNGFEVFSVGVIGKEKSYERPAQRVRCLTEQFPYVAEL